MNDFIQMAENLMRENAELRAENARYRERLNEAHEVTAPIEPQKCLRDIIAPLVEKYEDKTIHNVSTFRRVYEEMDIDWSAEVVNCIKAHNLTRIPHKAYIVEVSPVLTAEFERVVHLLLAQ